MFNINSVSLDAWKAILRQSRDTAGPLPRRQWQHQSRQCLLLLLSAHLHRRRSRLGFRIQGDPTAPFPPRPNSPATACSPTADRRARRGNREGNPETRPLPFARRVRQPPAHHGQGSRHRLHHPESARQPRQHGVVAAKPVCRVQAVATEITSQPPGNTDYKFPEAALGSSAFGVPGWVRQADILKPLAPILSARDDTFTIRGYGDSRERQPKNRGPRMVRSRRPAPGGLCGPDRPGGRAVLHQMKSDANKRFGRRYEIVSFRWLDEKEI